MVLVEAIKPIPKKSRNRGLIVIGNGPAFLQIIVMLKDRDVLPVTNNNADFLTLQTFGAQPVKVDFTSSGLSILKDYPQGIVLVSSINNPRQILRALQHGIRKDQILLIARYPGMRKDFHHPYTFIIDTEDQFDKELWYRAQTLYQLAAMSEFFKIRIPEGQKTLKMLIVFFGAPDPDAIASGLALSRLFSRQAVTTFAATGRVQRFENRALLSYLKIAVLDLAQVTLDEYQVIVCVDAQPSFFAKAGLNIPFDICIDHHPDSGDNPVMPFLDVRKDHGSCSTILSQYFMYSKKTLPKGLATALLTGIKTDTANFTRSLGEPDIEILKFLYKRADRTVLQKLDFAQIPMRTLKYFKRAYNRMNMTGNLLYCHLGKVGYPDIGSIIAEHFLKIQKIQVSVVSCIHKERLLIYFRSLRPEIPAGEMAKSIFAGFGIGGGHVDMGRAEAELDKLPYPQKNIEGVVWGELKKTQVRLKAPKI